MTEHSKTDPRLFEQDEHVAAISTGSMAVDIITGVMGFPRGRVTEVSGIEHSGKTTLCLTACAYCQLNGLYPAYLDVENALDLDYARHIGFNFEDTKKGLIAAPGSSERVFKLVYDLIEAGADLILVDSVANMIAEKELEGEIGDQSPPALRARVMSQALPRLTALLREKKTALVFINQFRNTLSQTSWGSQPEEQTMGGKALKYFSSLRIKLRVVKKSQQTRKVSDLTGTERDVPVAALHEAEILKSKVSAPYRKIQFMIRFDDELNTYGIDNLSTMIDIGKAQDLITGKGAWLEYGGVKANGDAAFFQALRAKPEVMQALKAEVLALDALKGKA